MVIDYMCLQRCFIFSKKSPKRGNKKSNIINLEKDVHVVKGLSVKYEKLTHKKNLALHLSNKFIITSQDVLEWNGDRGRAKREIGKK
jgi:hypothetical protein